ncbi:bactofilin family protein [Hyalangium gracile]|uniref:polymer-forming cytoskeletal protein n=1 Tax=Hyalangium gracile TaxID=394092 RepID=UPI001CCA498D|nr:polymer-forming cytoskeletal protein [Hyalangium gracile]
MKIATRILLPTLLLGAPLALAEAPSPAAAEAPAAKTIDVNFRGTLQDALKRIAEEGGLNVVATGALETTVEVHLKGVTAEQALRTIARTYSLRLDQDGAIFTMRPMTHDEKESAQESAKAAAGSQAVPSMPSMPSMPALPSMPPVPPMPPMPPGIAESAEDEIDPSEIRERVRDEVRKAQRRRKGERDVVARGHPLEVRKDDSVDNAVVYGSNLVVRGHVEEDVVAFGGNVDIYGSVEGDANAFGGNITLHPGAVVDGDVSAIGGNVIREEGAHVNGSTESFGGSNVGALVAGEVKKSLKKEFRNKDAAAEDEDDDHGGGGLPWFIIKFAALFGLGFLGQLFFPARMKDLSTEIRTQPIKSTMVGVLGAVALFPISLVLTITIIGAPVAAALWLMAMLVTVLGFTAVASEIGLRVPIMRGRKTQAVVLALGLVILLAMTSIPVLGWFVLFAACFMGFGAALLTRFGHRLRGIPEPLSRTPTSI